MDKAADIVIILFLAITVLLYINNRARGLAMLLIARILVPETVRVLGNRISLNTSIILILLILSIISELLRLGEIRAWEKAILAVLCFVLYISITLLLSDFGDLRAQFRVLLQFVITDLVPPVLFVLNIRDDKDFRIIVRAFLIITIICCSYGLLTVIISGNPYLELVGSMFGASVMLRDGTIWIGKETSSTFVSTNAFGYYISLSLPFCAFIRSKRIEPYLSTISIILLMINSILCKKRTTLVVVIFFLCIWYISSDKDKRIKRLVIAFVPLIALIAVVFLVPYFSSVRNVVMTSVLFWNDKLFKQVSEGAGGSTWALRLRQFTYPFVEIKKNIVFGHGFGWCAWYLDTKGVHRKLLGFETVLSQIVCEFGILGYPFYAFIMYRAWRYAGNSIYIPNRDKMITVYILTSIVLMIGTGAVYWYLFFAFTVVMHKYNTIYHDNGLITLVCDKSSLAGNRN